MKRTSKRFPALLRVGSNLIPVVMTMVIALGWWQPASAACPGVTVPVGFDCQVFVDPAEIGGAVTGMTFDSLGNLYYTTGFNQSGFGGAGAARTRCVTYANGRQGR